MTYYVPITRMGLPAQIRPHRDRHRKARWRKEQLGLWREIRDVMPNAIRRLRRRMALACNRLKPTAIKRVTPLSRNLRSFSHDRRHANINVPNARSE